MEKAVLIPLMTVSGESLHGGFCRGKGDDTMPFAEVRRHTGGKLSEELKAAGIEIHGFFCVVYREKDMATGQKGKIWNCSRKLTVNDGHFILKTGSGPLNKCVL